MSPTQADSSVDVPPHADAASEAESVQNAWGNDSAPAAPQINPSAISEAPVSPKDDFPTPADTNQPETTEPNDEEVGEFVTASTDPLKRPIYDVTEEDDETLQLLNSNSAPEWETDTFVGIGLVEPVRVGSDMTRRRVLRAGKLARWKLNLSREKMVIEAAKKKRTPLDGIGGAGGSDAPAAAPPPAKVDVKGDVTKPATTPIKADPNQYLQIPRLATSAFNMNGVIQPVSFVGPAIDELMETERKAWTP